MPMRGEADRGRDADCRPVIPTPEPIVLRSGQAVANRAMASAEQTRYAQPALVNGTVGLAMATGGRLSLAIAFTYTDGKITEIDIIARPAHLGSLELGVVDTEPGAPVPVRQSRLDA
jgi:RNA polymerase sigma-70 factor (ECF subfamily)